MIRGKGEEGKRERGEKRKRGKGEEGIFRISLFPSFPFPLFPFFPPFVGLDVQVVERGLEFVTLRIEFVLISVGVDVNRCRNVDAGAGEGFRDLKLVPAWHGPKTFERHCYRHDRMSGFFCKKHCAHFHYVARTLWTIDGKCSRTLCPHQPHHFDNRTNTTARTRTANRTVTKSLNETRDIFAIKTARRQHDDLPVSPPVSC